MQKYASLFHYVRSNDTNCDEFISALQNLFDAELSNRKLAAKSA